MMKKALTVAATAAVIAGVAAGTSRPATHAWTSSVVASGLDSPRGLAIEKDGTLLVAESGHGGDVCRSAGPLGEECLGTTSRISKVDTGSGAITPLVTGLWSRSVTLQGITGVDGIATRGSDVFGVMTGAPQFDAGFDCTGQPADCQSVVAASQAQAGQLIQATNGGTWKAVAGVGEKDFALTLQDPSLSADGPNANPYGVLPLPGGEWVADAGTNVLNFVTASGDIVLSSRIPKAAPGGFPADGVPTCLAMLRGNLYVGDLGGRLWERNGQFEPTQVPVTDGSGAPLLHHVTGCVSDGLDHIYLVDMWGTPGPPIPAGPGSAAGTGSVVEYTRGGGATVIASGLDFPNGIALAKDGSLYVSVGSTCTATGTPFPYCAKGGQIVRLQP
jgi:hypothetical protein